MEYHEAFKASCYQEAAHPEAYVLAGTGYHRYRDLFVDRRKRWIERKFTIGLFRNS